MVNYFVNKGNVYRSVFIPTVLNHMTSYIYKLHAGNMFLKCLWSNFCAHHFLSDAASDKKNLKIKQHMLNEQMSFPWKQIKSSSKRKTK